MILKLQKDGRTLVERVEVADTFLRRAVGLLGRAGLPPGQGLWLTPGGSIHTWGMAFTLDVFFLDRSMRVVCVARNVPPWRMLFGGRHAHSVVELAAGWLPAEAVRPGDKLGWDVAAEI